MPRPSIPTTRSGQPPLIYISAHTGADRFSNLYMRLSARRIPVSRGLSGQSRLGTQNRATPTACLPRVTPSLSTYSKVLLICANASKSGEVNDSRVELDLNDAREEYLKASAKGKTTIRAITHKIA